MLRKFYFQSRLISGEFTVGQGGFDAIAEFVDYMFEREDALHRSRAALQAHMLFPKK